MKLASSTRYHGQLFNAANVDYTAYLHLGLKCPHCGDPVFLAGAHDRHLASGEIAHISAQFRHFGVSDPVLVRQCVARVARYDEREVTRRASVARHQRLKILQRWFWSIFTDRAETLVLYLEDPDTEETRVMSRPLVEPVRQYFAKSGDKDVDRALDFLTEPFEDDPEITDPRLKRDLTRLTQMDLRLHAAICKEVLKFLQSRTSTYMFNQAIIGSIGLSYYGEASRRALDNGGDIVQIAYIKLIGLLTVIPWADEFSLYEHQQKSRLAPVHS